MPTAKVGWRYRLEHNVLGLVGRKVGEREESVKNWAPEKVS